MAKRLTGIGAVVVLSILSGLLLRGCGPSIQAPEVQTQTAGSGKVGLDLSKLIVWNRDVIASRSHGLYKTVQEFYDRTGRRIEGWNLDYCVHNARGNPDFHEGLVSAWHDDETHLWGCVDRAGRVVVPFQFGFVGDFSDGRAVAGSKDYDAFKNPCRGLIDGQGKWIVPAGKYQEICDGSEGRWAFDASPRGTERHQWGFLDANGGVAIQPTFSSVDPFCDGLSLVEDANGQAFIDRQGQIAFRLGANVHCVSEFSCKRAVIFTGINTPKLGDNDSLKPDRTDVRAGFVDPNGKIVIKALYIAAGGFTEGLAPVSMSKGSWFTSTEDEEYGNLIDTTDNPDPIQRWGFIDTTGKLVIPMKFNQVSQFSEGLARVRLDGKWGFIDKTGKFVIPLRYEWAESFHNGIAFAVLDGMILLIDRQGKTIVNTGTRYELF